MAAPTFRSFISEKEIEAVNKKKQEEWERVRRPDQPLGEFRCAGYQCVCVQELLMKLVLQVSQKCCIN